MKNSGTDRIATGFRLVFVMALLLVGYHAGLIHRPGHPRDAEGLQFPSSPLDFRATAYCNYGMTKSGVSVARGMVAADPSVLPLGSLVRLDAFEYTGVYRVMDTGHLIKGNKIDIYIPSEASALKFGRQKIKVIVLRYGYPRSNRGVTRTNRTTNGPTDRFTKRGNPRHSFSDTKEFLTA